MQLIADQEIIAAGTLEHCIYISNNMTYKERQQYKDIFIASEDGKIYLRQDGKERKNIF